jgi:hypothetical protein
MVFVIEVSFYLHQHSNLTFFKDTLIELAENWGCITHYFMEEMRGKNCVSIHVIHFPSEISDAWRACDYIKNIKKIKQVIIESVYYDEIKGQILYASKEYLKDMDKEGCKLIQGKKSGSVKKRERSYSESEIMMLNALNKYKKRNKLNKNIANSNDLKTVNNNDNDGSKVLGNLNKPIMSYSSYLEMIK